MNAENKEKSMWSMQELDEKSRWAFEHPHDAKAVSYTHLTLPTT